MSDTQFVIGSFVAFAVTILIAFGVVRFINAPSAPKGTAKAKFAGLSFTIFTHSPLFVLALGGLIWAVREYGPVYFPGMNLWLLGGPLVALLYVLWPSIYGLAFKKPEGYNEADLVLMFAMVAFAAYCLSVTWTMADNCVNGGNMCRSGSFAWTQFYDATMRFLGCPGNWILLAIGAYCYRYSTRKIESGFWKVMPYVIGGLAVLSWLFWVLPYVDAGWNGHTLHEIWTRTGHNPPAWLVSLLPITFG